MSLLLHFIAKLIFFSVLTVVVLALLTWLTQRTGSDRTTRPSLSELPEDKGTYLNRISARRPSSSGRDSKEERRRA